jgi:hypothetical protein
MLKGSNQSNLKLRVPEDVKLMTSLDGADTRCFQERKDGIVTVHFRAPKGAQEHKLSIFAKRGTSEGSFQQVCEFSVVGSVGPARFVEAPFPRIWVDSFVEHGVKFADQSLIGCLKPDAKGKVSVRLQLPMEKKVTAKLESKKGKDIVALCERVDSNTVQITCATNLADVSTSEHQLVVFAASVSDSSFQAVVSYLVAA